MKNKCPSNQPEIPQPHSFDIDRNKPNSFFHFESNLAARDASHSSVTMTAIGRNKEISLGQLSLESIKKVSNERPQFSPLSRFYEDGMNRRYGYSQYRFDLLQSSNGNTIDCPREIQHVRSAPNLRGFKDRVGHLSCPQDEEGPDPPSDERSDQPSSSLHESNDESDDTSDCSPIECAKQINTNDGDYFTQVVPITSHNHSTHPPTGISDSSLGTLTNDDHFLTPQLFIDISHSKHESDNSVPSVLPTSGRSTNRNDGIFATEPSRLRLMMKLGLGRSDR